MAEIGHGTYAVILLEPAQDIGTPEGVGLLLTIRADSTGEACRAFNVYLEEHGIAYTYETVHFTPGDGVSCIDIEPVGFGEEE